MRNILLFSLWFLLFISQNGYGQRFQSINDELPFAESRVIYQDSFGFLWFGTTEGLVKYDGYSTIEYRKIPGEETSLPGTKVNAIVQFNDSLLLIGFDHYGLAEFNRNTGKSRKINLGEDLETLHVKSLLKDSKESIWIGTNKGLYGIDNYSDTTLDTLSIAFSYLANNTILRLFEDRDSNIWIGTFNGINTITNGTTVVEGPDINSSFPENEVISIQENNRGILWVSFRNGKSKIHEWDPDKRMLKPIERFDRDGEFSFVFDSNNDIWASSHARGIYHFKENEETFYSENDYRWHGMRAMFTYSIYGDKYDNIWVESDEVYKMPGNHKEFYSIESDQFQVISVFADKDYIWYCSKEPYRWSRTKRQSEAYLDKYDFTELINPQRVRNHKRIYKYQEWGDSIVFTSIRNVFVWNRKNDTYTEYPTRLNGAFREFFIDSTNHIWIPGHQGNPVKVDLESGEVKELPDLALMTSGCTVAQSDKGVQWWGTHSHGLFSYDPTSGSIKQFVPDPDNPNTTISSFSINDILISTNSSVWVATKLGLNRIDPQSNSIKHYSFKDYLSNTSINSLLEDKGGTLWIGTENGLINFDPVKNTIRHFTIADGIINTNFTPRACFKDKKGWLYFGGNNGIDYFNPENISTNTIAPDLYIKKVDVNGSDINKNITGELLNTIELKYNQNFVVLELTGLHYVAPEAQEYAYRLPLQSHEWISLGQNRTITLANLSPGNYVLEAKGSNPDGYWSKPKQLLQLRIHPPFWKSSWVLALIALLIILLTYLIYSRRIKQIRKAENIKTEFNKRIAEIEMKALRAQMNPHFLFNSLNSIRLLVDKGDNEAAKNYLTIYSQLIRQILNNSQSKFIRLEHEIQVLKHYLDLEKMRFKNFKYSISVEDDVETDFLEVPPLLMQPYVENAIWHGLMHKQDGDRYLDIRIGKDEEFVNIEIEDNGIGRKQSEKINTSRSVRKESLGLKISDDRIKFLKEIYGKEAFVHIIDLENPTGTKVLIQLPLRD